MNYSSIGFFRARVYTASEALPIERAIVRIYGNEELNGGVEYSVQTSRDGLTEVVNLPTPNMNYSLSPNPVEQPYATYNIEITKNGYYKKTIENIAVFANTLSLLPVEMVPNAGLTKNTTPPKDTNFSIITENEELE